MIHYNFPITLLKGFTEHENQGRILDDILFYATYCKAVTLSGAYVDEVEEFYPDAKYELKWEKGDESEQFKRGSELYEEHSTSAHCGISHQMYWRHYNNLKQGGTISKRELIQLLGFLAAKSILGKNPFKKMTNDFLKARMSGYNKQVDADSFPEFISSTMNDYQIRKLKGDLCESWGMVHYSRNMRGFYLGYKNKVTLEALALLAERNTRKSKDKIRARKEREAQAEARRRLEF